MLHSPRLPSLCTLARDAPFVSPPYAPCPDRKLAFLQHMLSFAQHPYLLLADKALPMWVKLLQDAAQSVSHAAAAAAGGSGAAAAAAAGGGGGSAGSSPRQATVQLPPECVEALMTMAAEQLQVRWLGVWLCGRCWCRKPAHAAARVVEAAAGRQALLGGCAALQPGASLSEESCHPIWLQKRGHVPQEDEDFPPYFDTFAVSLARCVVGW